MAPGGLACATTDELRAALEGGTDKIYLLPIVYFLDGSPLNVSGIEVTLEGLGGEQGATLDCGNLSRAIDVIDGGQLTLRRIHVVNGAADSGGGLLVEGAGSTLLMEQGSVRDCVATGPVSFVDGGGSLACLDRPEPRARRPVHVGPGP